MIVGFWKSKSVFFFKYIRDIIVVYSISVSFHSKENCCHVFILQMIVESMLPLGVCDVRIDVSTLTTV